MVLFLCRSIRNEKCNVMNYDNVDTPLYKSVMAGLATGIIAACINLAYNFVYRGITQFAPSISVINVATIIFASTLICIVAGLLFYFIVEYLKKDTKIFRWIFIIITLIVIASALLIGGMSGKFEGLYFGVVVITSICSAFLIPWLFSHKNAFF